MNAKNINFNDVRYAQEYFYPYFSHRTMSVSETYVALVFGLLDPKSLAPIRIFEVEGHSYCIDTRRLTIVKELQQRNKLDVLENFPVQYMLINDEESARQYWNLVNCRLPAMKKSGLDGSTIRLESEPDYMCCFNKGTNTFRSDLEQHIIQKHLNMRVPTFKNLNIYKCYKCDKQGHIFARKRSTQSVYEIFRKCACPECESNKIYKMQVPWTEVTFAELCSKILELKQSLVRSNQLERNISQPIASHQLSRNKDTEYFITPCFIFTLIIAICIALAYILTSKWPKTYHNYVDIN
ncbi:unnamed protein product [Adineta steineri]|uniref:Uncharacterized protein n=1 Tax=Adineta steineri TaxID=433720 RepID=A0A813NVF5_9BILA|nr:unnamed protein product [Adineta steineri]